ncbi:unnamed protein product [Meloidogyne enterolobii]|uniref:Uncharacterized protein n=1 Tax=Meloidogyne enterolobii TaxID=390850 RepID=A0ACB0Y612_MELEN
MELNHHFLDKVRNMKVSQRKLPKLQIGIMKTKKSYGKKNMIKRDIRRIRKRYISKE